MKAIDSFFDEYRFLSNFYPARVWFSPTGMPEDDIWLPTVEHAYQCLKSPLFFTDANITLDDYRALSPGRAKRLGSRVHLRIDWEDVKLAFMECLLRQKFRARGALAKRLIETHPAELIEGNRWHDNFWGHCTCQKCENEPHLNHLGRLLMEIREELMNAQA